MYEDRLRWVVHKEKRILILDYSGLRNDDLPIIFKEIVEKIKNEPLGSCRYFVNVKNLNFSVKTLSLFNKFADDTKNWDKCSAVFGATGLIKIMYDGFSKIFTKPIKAFSDKEEKEALDWLANY